MCDTAQGKAVMVPLHTSTYDLFKINSFFVIVVDTARCI